MNFQGKKGPGHPVILSRHLSEGGKKKEAARKRSEASKKMAKVTTPPLNWERK